MDLLLTLLAPRNVLADAAIAHEDARVVEHGLAAHADPDLPAEFVEATQLQIVEGLAVIENRHMRRPVDGRHVEIALFPEFLAEKIETELLGAHRTGPGKRSEAILVVLLPVQVG